MVRKSVCKHVLLSEVDNDGGFFVGILVDDLPCYKSSVCGGPCKLEMLQHFAARFISNKPWRRNHRDSINYMLRLLNWPSFKEHRRHSYLILILKFLNRMIHISTQFLPVPSPLTITRINRNHKS